MIYDVVILGCGPAGMTAAIYALRAGKTVLLIEEAAPGGQILFAHEVENFPAFRRISGAELSDRMFQQIMDLGAVVESDRVSKVEKQDDIFHITTDYGKFEGRTLIVATGVKNRPLGVDREEALVGAGVSYCALCDGNFFKGRPVAVVGGGNTALQDALYLADLCSEVYLIHRRDSFRGEETRVQAIRSRDNIKLMLNSQVTALRGDRVVEGLTVQNKVTGAETEIGCAAVFVAVGKVADSSFLGDLVPTDAGYILADESCRTPCAGLFAAGDCRSKTVRQLTTAVADGSAAATAAIEYLNEK